VLKQRLTQKMGAPKAGGGGLGEIVEEDEN